VLSIASFVVCPLLPAIIGLVIASSAKQEIAQSGGTLSGEGMVTAAKVISWVNIALCVVVVIGVAALVPFSTSHSNV
jgi:hypothetical protein